MKCLFCSGAITPKPINKCKYRDCNGTDIGGGWCDRHGGGPRCMKAGCNNKAAYKHELCRRHGGTNRCKIENCYKKDMSRGYCVTHDFEKQCKQPGCVTYPAMGGTKRGYCRRHGGGPRCQFKGCTTGAQKNGYCINHSKYPECLYPGCRKRTERGTTCTSHNGEINDEPPEIVTRILQDINLFNIFNPYMVEHLKRYANRSYLIMAYLYRHDQIEYNLEYENTLYKKITATIIRLSDNNDDDIVNDVFRSLTPKDMAYLLRLNKFVFEGDIEKCFLLHVRENIKSYLALFRQRHKKS
jgi:hypothetical protein